MRDKAGEVAEGDYGVPGQPCGCWRATEDLKEVGCDEICIFNRSFQ